MPSSFFFRSRETDAQRSARQEAERNAAAEKLAREQAAAAAKARKEFHNSVETQTFDVAGSEFTFSARQKSENNWDDEQLKVADREYRRFQILAVENDEPLVPSRTIDKFWQVHLLYNRQYISGFCGRALKKLVHRKPAGAANFDLNAAYERTLALYEATFGEAPNWDGPAGSYCKVQALPQTTEERNAAKQSQDSGSSDAWLVLYIVAINSSYSDSSQIHGSGSTSSGDSSSSSSSSSCGGSSCGGGGCGGGC